MKNCFFSRNIFFVLAYRMILILTLYSLARIEFYLFNMKMFPGITPDQLFNIMAGGVLFDISALVYINMIFILLHIIPFEIRYNRIYQVILKYLYFITNGIALAAAYADFVYYRFIGKRATADVFQTFSNENNKLKLSLQFITDYWPATFLFILSVFLMVYFYGRVTAVKPVVRNRFAYYLLNVLMIPVVAALVIGGARGGYKHSTRPITISNAARYVESPGDAAIVLNTPFSLLRTFDKKSLTRYSFYDDKTLKSIYNPHYKPSGTMEFKPMNVVVIILESFAREYIGALNKDLDGGTYKGYTPFIDSLISVSLTFDVSLASGRKSIDAMPSILASIPSLETPYIISHYANNRINGLAELLKRKGFYTAFFHGAPNGSMGFDSFAKMAGFDDYFGLDQYPWKKDFDGMWGVWDEPFFNFFAGKLNEFKEPFLASIFSVSSHHPFMVPEHYKGKFPTGPVPVLEVVGYTDHAVKKFFDRIKDEPWFMNTLFVITADHTNEPAHREFQNTFGAFSIPIIFYKPGSNITGVKNQIAQQIDIMPTVLSWLNYDEEYIAFGNNILDDTSYVSFGFNSSGNNYHLYMEDHILVMIDTSTVGLYNYKNDRLLENNLAGKELVLQKKMEGKLKAVMQTYNERLLDNNMTVTVNDSNSN
jgi:phosphoglycerol transferase MdoB-like AlkP superfamily enzyme